jgi:uncharacterized membrane protein YbhN (UPF0104 family)
MKPFYKQKYFYILTSILLLISLGVPFICYFIFNALNIKEFPYVYLFVIFAGLYFLLSYVVGDVYIVRYKQKEGIITSSLPEEVINKSKELRKPFIASFLITLLVFIIFYIIYASTGSWPLL